MSVALLEKQFDAQGVSEAQMREKLYHCIKTNWFYHRFPKGTTRAIMDAEWNADPVAGYVTQLQKNGYVVVPTGLKGAIQTNGNTVVREMKQIMRDFPEFTAGAEKFVLGGFSALGNPASFHNPFVRKLRLQIMEHMVPFFSEYVSRLPDPGAWNVEQVVDRMLHRHAGTSAVSESWHRDETPRAKQSDKTFGGWWNLDNHPQYFSCVPCTHTGVRGHSGFSTVKNKADKDRYNALRTKVEIPPGSILLFYEHMMHEVISTKAKVDQHRLFVGWRVTKETEPLFEVDNRVKQQAVMLLKSGQFPPMYSRLHWTNWRQKILDFSAFVTKECTVSRRMESGKDKGKVYQIVGQHMQSLADYGLPRYPAYRRIEKEILKPRHAWDFGNGKVSLTK